MKELSIEEKAKRYDEAIERAKEFKEHLLEINEKDYADEMDYVFPELAESDDERIRKALIYHYQGDGCISTNEYRIDYKDIRAWLEKQGEHANFRNSIQVGDKVTRNRDGMLVNLSQLKRVAKPAESKKHDVCDNCDQQGSCVSPCSMKLVEKQGEQNPAWSEEDEENLNWFEKFFRAESVIAEGKDIPQDRYLWFKNLKDRVQPQHKEWSEEDDEMLNLIIARLHSHPNIDLEEYSKEYNWLNYRLKSLCPQNTWKPSDEQMEIFEYYIQADICNKDREVLLGLYNDLKKLKEK